MSLRSRGTGIQRNPLRQPKPRLIAVPEYVPGLVVLASRTWTSRRNPNENAQIRLAMPETTTPAHFAARLRRRSLPMPTFCPRVIGRAIKPPTHLGASPPENIVLLRGCAAWIRGRASRAEGLGVQHCDVPGPWVTCAKRCLVASCVLPGYAVVINRVP